MRLHLNWNKSKGAMAAKAKEVEKVKGPKEDTTEYLLRDPLNRERLLKAVSDLKNGNQNIQERGLIEK